MAMFLLDFAAEMYVEIKYGITQTNHNIGDLITGTSVAGTEQFGIKEQDNNLEIHQEQAHQLSKGHTSTDLENTTFKTDRSFRQQIAAFIILEFGVIFHSVVIGLNLGTAGKEFAALYPVLVFHQSFEGLGIGARMSSIPFPKRWEWLQWALCAGYGLTTPIAIAVGLGVRTTYNSGSFTANIVSGIFDSVSAGILIYTGLVELLARDFLFNPERTMDRRQLTFMIACTLAGAGVMALLGKWA
jgi:zinc transporter 1/2/3